MPLFFHVHSFFTRSFVPQPSWGSQTLRLAVLEHKILVPNIINVMNDMIKYHKQLGIKQQKEAEYRYFVGVDGWRSFSVAEMSFNTGLAVSTSYCIHCRHVTIFHHTDTAEAWKTKSSASPKSRRKNSLIPRLHEEADMKQTYSIYTGTTCTLSLLEVCFMYAKNFLSIPDLWWLWSFLRHKAHRVALFSVSLTLSQTPVYTAKWSWKQA